MHRTPDRIITPPGQQIPRIHHARPLDRRRVHEPTTGALHLQPAPAVLEQKRDRPVVRVRPGAHAARVAPEHVASHGRVVQQAQGVVGVADEAVEEGLVGQAHADGDGAHDRRVQRRELREEGGHGGAEAWHGGRGGLVGPAVGVGRLVVATHLEGFFDVGAGGAQRRDGGARGELGDFLAPRGGVAAVGFGGGPCQGVFGGGREAEEGGRGVEDVGEGGGGDGDVREVDEAGGLEACEDGFGGFEFLGGRAVQEFGEVDELGRLGGWLVWCGVDGESE